MKKTILVGRALTALYLAAGLFPLITKRGMALFPRPSKGLPKSPVGLLRRKMEDNNRCKGDRRLRIGVKGLRFKV